MRTGETTREVEIETEIGIELEIFTVLLSCVNSDHIFKTYTEVY